MSFEGYTYCKSNRSSPGKAFRNNPVTCRALLLPLMLSERSHSCATCYPHTLKPDCVHHLPPHKLHGLLRTLNAFSIARQLLPCTLVLLQSTNFIVFHFLIWCCHYLLGLPGISQFAESLNYTRFFTCLNDFNLFFLYSLYNTVGPDLFIFFLLLFI